jgi:hypothetical protein
MAVRVALLVVWIGSAAVVFYGLVLDRTGQALAFTVAGLFVLGVTSAVLAMGCAVDAVNSGQAGRGLRAFAGGVVGGLFALAAAGALAGAVVFGVIATTS